MGNTEDQLFIVREAEYGQELTIELFNEDGSVYEIPDAATLTFLVYADDPDVSAYTVEDSSNIVLVGDRTLGVVKYTVQNGDFTVSDAGNYWFRVQVNNVSTFEGKLVCLDKFSRGS